MVKIHSETTLLQPNLKLVLKHNAIGVPGYTWSFYELGIGLRLEHIPSSASLKEINILLSLSLGSPSNSFTHPSF